MATIFSRVPMPVIAAALASLALAAGPLYWLYHSDQAVVAAEPTVELPASLTATQTPRPSRPLLSAAQIESLKLMGEAPPPPAPAAPPPKELPDTQLQLTLTGVFASPDPALAAALIKVNGQAPKYYKVGDEVTEGAILYSVAGSGITLRRDKDYERLAFERDKGERRQAVAVGQPEIVPRQIAPASQTIAALEQDNTLEPAAVSDTRAVSLRVRLERLRQTRQ